MKHWKKDDVAISLCGKFGYAVEYAAEDKNITCKKCREIFNKPPVELIQINGRISKRNEYKRKT